MRVYEVVKKKRNLLTSTIFFVHIEVLTAITAPTQLLSLLGELFLFLRGKGEKGGGILVSTAATFVIQEMIQRPGTTSLKLGIPCSSLVDSLPSFELFFSFSNPLH